VDFGSIEAVDVRGNYLFKKQQKTKGRVVVPLRPAAKQILEKRFANNLVPENNTVFNRNIKAIATRAGILQRIKHSWTKYNRIVEEVKPKSTWICSHTCRRSFCTNEFLAGTPVELIMKISGHKSVKDFYKYIRISPEEAALKMADIWQQRGEMQV